jgi:hypothetical protein
MKSFGHATQRLPNLKDFCFPFKFFFQKFLEKSNRPEIAAAHDSVTALLQNTSPARKE